MCLLLSRLPPPLAVQAIIQSLLVRLGAEVEVAVPSFGLLMANASTKENYWLTPGTPVADFIRKYLRLPLDDWK